MVIHSDRKQPGCWRGVQFGLMATAAALLAACGGGGGSAGSSSAEPPIPQLSAAVGATLSKCASLAGLAGFSYSGLTITSATSVPAGATVTMDATTYTMPENCYVQGSMNPHTGVDGQAYAVKFEMRLPKDWNGRFFFQPNGGNEGTLVPVGNQAYGRMMGGSPNATALNQGFAVLSSDSGHDGAANTTVAAPIRGQVFGIDPVARTNNAHRYVAILTPMAKSLIASAYGKGPDRSYMVGCSNGGRVGMVTAARYPDMFDGILAGAPAFNLPKAVVGGIWNGQAMAAIAPLVGGKADISNSFTAADMKAVSDRILAKCDALDGVTDGLVADRAACKAAFSLATDVTTCTGTPNGTCLSAIQKTALAKMMAGPKNTAGTALYTDWPYDPGMRDFGWRVWQMGSTAGPFNGSAPTTPASASNPTSLVLTLTAPSMAYMFTNPPASKTVMTGLGTTLFDYVMGYSMDTDAAKIFGTGNGFAESPYAEYTPPNPTQLSSLRNRGAKLLVYHGNADAVFSLNDTLNWYDGLTQNHSGDATAFSRVFPVPGMTHCAAGPSADKFDMVTALVNWVEKGQAPQSVTASIRPVSQNTGIDTTWPVNRTRVLCPHPKVARYKGTGDTEDAANFSCQ